MILFGWRPEWFHTDPRVCENRPFLFGLNVWTYNNRRRIFNRMTARRDMKTLPPVEIPKRFLHKRGVYFELLLFRHQFTFCIGKDTEYMV
jgi:hypothetical protein